MCSKIMVLAALSLPFLLNAQSTPSVKRVPATETSPASGKEMYVQYCATCHGKDGKGDGPAAKAMKTAPGDLTKLASQNGGAFPDVKVARLIDGADEISAHGSRDMPVWGRVFHEMEASGSTTAKLRISNLTAYLKSIQSR
jgi:mono/diheme cytochrome c family protein